MPIRLHDTFLTPTFENVGSSEMQSPTLQVMGLVPVSDPIQSPIFDPTWVSPKHQHDDDYESGHHSGHGPTGVCAT